MTLFERIKAETPGWFKSIIKLGITVAAVGAALLTANGAITGFHLPATMEQAAQWMIVAGLVASAVSKTAKSDTPNA